MKKFFIHSYTQYVLLFLCIVVFIVLSLISAMKESLTFDEVVYFQEGRNALVQHTFDVDPYNPPLMREIGSLPYLLNAQYFKDPLFAQNHPLSGRAVMIIVGVLMLVAQFFVTRKFFGQEVAVFATILFSFEPNILANAHYMTLDIGLTFLFFLAYTIFVTQRNTVKNTISLSVIIGSGIAAKLSFIPFFILSITGTALLVQPKTFFKKIWNNIGKIILALLVAFFVVWMAYFFSYHVVIKERQDSNRVSEKLIQFGQNHHNAFIIAAMQFAKNQPVPLGDFLATIKNNALRSLQPGQCFFLGKFYSSCQWYFIFINTFLKIPLSIFIFFVVGAFSLFRKNRKQFFTMTIPIAAIFMTVSLLRMQPLVRYVLPALPFIIIISAYSWNFWKKNLLNLLFFSGLVLWFIGSTLSESPHFISYANEFAGYPQERFALLTDSNLDWGQNLFDVELYKKQHPETVILFSYFGRDDANAYSLRSDKPYGSYKANEICDFHTINAGGKKQITLMSSSNWYGCGYNKQKEFQKQKIEDVIGNTILIFNK